jgi:DMSO/TMAO reductase YedYZ molybdopterin-dependent catalytic subunit
MRSASDFGTLASMSHRLYGSRWHGIAIGLLSTFAGLAAAELITGLVRGASSPVLPVGQEIIDIVPIEVKNWAIDTFGTADKAVLLLGTVISLAVIGSIVGTLAVRGARSAAYAVTAVVGLIGVYAVSLRPAPTFGKMLPPIVGTLASIAVIWWLSPRREVDTAVTADAADAVDVPSGPGNDASDTVDATDTVDTEDSATVELVPVAGASRRGFLTGAGIVGLGALFVGGLGRVLKRRFDVDDERAALELPEVDDTIPATPAEGTTAAGATMEAYDFALAGLTPFVVPNGDFYRIDTALAVPQVPKDDWTLRIHGMVDQELELTFADLLARPMIERPITLSCVSNRIGGDLVGNAVWQGVRMKELLEEAGLDPAATQVVSRSIDGWSCGSPTSVIMDGRDAMLAIAMNGEPLPAEHGYPVRLVVPGLYGYVSATKWVTEIELTRWEDFDGYWVPRGWSKEGPIKTMARIDRPRSGRGLDRSTDGAVDIAGLAWCVHRGISKVEVQLDDGDWLECELAGVPSDDTWRQWRYQWADATPGEHRVTARAYDGAGDPQPIGPKDVAPDGAEGYHSVRFTVD